MITVNQVKNHLASYLANEVSFAEFEDWLLDRSWDMHKDSPDDAQALVNEINASVYDYLDNRVDENYLKSKLRPHLRQYNVVIADVITRPLYQPSSAGSVLEERRLAYG